LETLLLFATCGWIIWEAFKRLCLEGHTVDASPWAFLVVLISILVDLRRSQHLSHAAKIWHSQALEADALHFSTDVWSSCVVLVGLCCVKIGQLYPMWNFLGQMDALAAFGVAIIVMGVSYRLGVRTLIHLLDGAPTGAVEKIVGIVEAIPGVIDCHHVRIRTSGTDTFVDIHVKMDGGITLRQANKLTEIIEEQLQKAYPHADVTIHAEPEEAF
jgi:cation diffusion facilitator family transporter